MRRWLLILLCGLVVLQAPVVFADDAQTNAAAPAGNQGYIYGAPPPADNSTDSSAPAASSSSDTQEQGPISSIGSALQKLDAWVQQNLW